MVATYKLLERYHTCYMRRQLSQPGAHKAFSSSSLVFWQCFSSMPTLQFRGDECLCQAFSNSAIPNVLRADEREQLLSRYPHGTVCILAGSMSAPRGSLPNLLLHTNPTHISKHQQTFDATQAYDTPIHIEMIFKHVTSREERSNSDLEEWRVSFFNCLACKSSSRVKTTSDGCGAPA